MCIKPKRVEPKWLVNACITRVHQLSPKSWIVTTANLWCRASGRGKTENAAYHAALTNLKAKTDRGYEPDG